MDPLTMGALVGGNILGSVMENNLNNQAVNNQEDFQRGMSNTAYQRSTADMEKAGLNPMLMYGSGAAASTPAGSAAPQTSPISTGASSASAVMAQSKQMDAQDASIDLAHSQSDNYDQETENAVAQKAVIQNTQQLNAKDIEAKGYANQIMSKTLNAQIKKANAEGNYAEVNQIMGLINSGASSAGQLLNLVPKMKQPELAPPVHKSIGF